MAKFLLTHYKVVPPPLENYRTDWRKGKPGLVKSGQVKSEQDC